MADLTSFKPKKNLALNINMDSMAEALGFPPNFHDPTWFTIMDRFLTRLADRNWPCSIFVVGKDLEYPDVAARVKDFSQMGHEIGNHSYSHSMSFGSYSRDYIRGEIARAHDLIAQTTGQIPLGFMAPAWGANPHLPPLLAELGYAYDASPFPSIWSLAMIIGYFLTLKDSAPDRLKEAMRRRDYFTGLRLPRHACEITGDYQPLQPGQTGIKVLPLPTFNRLSLPVWHTAAFFGTRTLKPAHIDWHLRRVEKMIQQSRSPYYLLHPADFFTPQDFPADKNGVFWRQGFSLKQKMDLLDAVLDRIASLDCEMVTMKTLSDRLDYANPLFAKSLTGWSPTP